MRPTLEQIRNIEWERSWLWGVIFPSYPKIGVFDGWLPITSVDANIIALGSETFNIGNMEVGVPHRTTISRIALTFIDSKNHDLFRWFADWANNNILTENLMEVVPLLSGTASRDISISWLGLQNEITKTLNFAVCLEGDYGFRGTSEPQPEETTIELKVVGYDPDNADWYS